MTHFLDTWGSHGSTKMSPVIFLFIFNLNFPTKSVEKVCFFGNWKLSRHNMEGGGTGQCQQMTHGRTVDGGLKSVAYVLF